MIDLILLCSNYRKRLHWRKWIGWLPKRVCGVCQQCRYRPRSCFWCYDDRIKRMFPGSIRWQQGWKDWDSRGKLLGFFNLHLIKETTTLMWRVIDIDWWKIENLFLTEIYAHTHNNIAYHCRFILDKYIGQLFLHPNLWQ